MAKVDTGSGHSRLLSPVEPLTTVIRDSEVRVYGAEGKALLADLETASIYYLGPCCHREWTIAQVGWSDCGSCGRELRPKSSSGDWLETLGEEIFDGWGPLEQEMLIGVLRSAFAETELTPLAWALRVEAGFREVATLR